MNYKIYLSKKIGYKTVTTIVTNFKYIYFVGGNRPIEFECSSNDPGEIDRCVVEICDRLNLDYDNIDHVNDKVF